LRSKGLALAAGLAMTFIANPVKIAALVGDSVSL
jgi:hypothetical protein